MKYFSYKTHYLQQRFFFGILAVSLFLALPVLTFAAPGDLDPTFGTGGKVITVLPSRISSHKMAIQSDGKIVVQGYSPNNFSSYLVRFNSNGTLDTGFGNGGTVIIPRQNPLYQSFSNGLAILPDDKILISGIAYKPFVGYSDFLVFRFNSNGSYDTSFGTNGFAAVSFPEGNFNIDCKLQVQPDGKIVVFGNLRRSDNTGNYFEGVGLARFNADGSLDAAFGTGGKLIIRVSNANDVDGVADLAILPNGKLLLIGKMLPDYDDIDIFLSRINPNGTLDASFGTNGFLLLELNEFNNYVSQIALQPDGKIVFPTHQSDFDGFDVSSTIVRLNADGTFDASFGTNGKVVTGFESSFSSTVLIQPNGKILAGGVTLDAAPRRFAIIRLNADGSRDISFGLNGIVTTLLAPSSNFITDMALQSDGKLIAVGEVIISGNYLDTKIGLARYLLDAPRPPQFDFDGDGKSDISVFRPSDRVWYLNQSTNGFSATQFGLSTDKITPADYDGDGRTDIAVFRDGNWYYLKSSNNAFVGLTFGQAGDIPRPADFDGDGKADINVFRPSNGAWYRLNSSDGLFYGIQFGQDGDKPLTADFDGDGKSDIAVFRPTSSGVFYWLESSTDEFKANAFGFGSDVPTLADFDGDGKTDIAVFRPSNGAWYRINSSTVAFYGILFGQNGDVPVPADYDGDGKSDIAVFRNGDWYRLNSSNGGFVGQAFGFGTDKPLPASFNQ